MSAIVLQRDHALGLRRARTAANRIARDLAERYGCECVWQENTLHIARPGVSGTMTIAKDAVDVRLELGFLLAAFKPKIEASIREGVGKYFA